MADLNILAHADTAIGTFYLSTRPEVGTSRSIFEIYIGGAMLMSNVSPVSEQELATRALALHPAKTPLRVLVGGLGLGHTAEAVLADPRVESVRVVEKMEFVIDWMNRGLLPLSEVVNGDKRVEIVQGDVYDDLLGPAAETYDLILVDVDHSPGDRLSDASKPFYTVEGQRLVARHLKPGGLLAIWSAVDDEELPKVLDEHYPKSHREYVAWDNNENPDSHYENVLFFGLTS